jgi:hypothetical protein
MPTKLSGQEAAIPSLRDSLESLDGIVCALLDEDAARVWLVCRGDASTARVEEHARTVLAAAGMDPAPWTVSIARPEQDDSRRRVRFRNVDQEIVGGGQTRIRVTLEWQGSVYEGEALGERGMPIELRSAATAAIDALQKVSEAAAGVRLVGVKQMRAFDADLLVVALYRPGSPPQKLVGAVLMSPDPHRAAAVAVLNALNRVLGNYLAVS